MKCEIIALSIIFTRTTINIKIWSAILLPSINDPLVLSLHSFTPTMNGVVRPWEMGVLLDQDEVLAKQLIANLSKVTGFNIGDNKPYHATYPLGYAHVIHSHERAWN